MFKIILSSTYVHELQGGGKFSKTEMKKISGKYSEYSLLNSTCSYFIKSNSISGYKSGFH